VSYILVASAVGETDEPPTPHERAFDRLTGRIGQDKALTPSVRRHPRRDLSNGLSAAATSGRAGRQAAGRESDSNDGVLGVVIGAYGVDAVAPVDGRLEHRQSGRRERRRRRVQDEESRRTTGQRAGEGDERDDDRDRGELLRRVAAASAQSRGPWLVARS